ncbi:preprotein translocase subunit YajC [Modestobacter sp. KNN46-3]|uniref:preprotein translocase subunit YajC n=1 Tax=Modestobacter sp. KNN46-3 TaxID=2711218 RepID=UPI0013DF0583|nr:preprotein translocase subunit YajC [Modestobacter sp. KNN46-3]
MEQFFPLILLVLAFGLLIVLPARQRKKMQANAQALQASLTVGTPVMLTSGIHGTVASLGEGTVGLEIAPGVVITVARPAVMEVRQPASGAAPPEGATGTIDGDGDPTDRTR